MPVAIIKKDRYQMKRSFYKIMIGSNFICESFVFYQDLQKQF